MPHDEAATPSEAPEGASPAGGHLAVVGIGPGADEHITPAALAAIQEADVVVGYRTYIRLVRHLLDEKVVVQTGMTEEIGRARSAIEQARDGLRVALISSGDAGVYGMAGLVFHVLEQMGWKRGDAPELTVIPGVSAVNACAALVGAPLVHDFCTISLSDLLTPWSIIENRLEHAAAGDFVIALYNPASGRRTRQIVRAREIIGAHRPDETPVALVKSGWRRQQTVVHTDLGHFLEYEIGMLTTVLVGSSQTRMFEGYMVTPRGYANKYDEDGEVLSGRTPGRSLDPSLGLDGLRGGTR